MKKVPAGVQRGRDVSTGIFMKKTSETEWSLPVSLHFAEGSVGFTQLPYEMGNKADLLILLNDQQVVNAFEAFGQVGFNDQSYPLVQGPVVGGRDDDVMNFVMQLSQDPSLATSKNFAYSLNGGRIQGALVDGAVLQVRETSNQKYYGNKNATIHNIVKSLVVIPHFKQHTVKSAQQKLGAFMGMVMESAPRYQQQADLSPIAVPPSQGSRMSHWASSTSSSSSGYEVASPYQTPVPETNSAKHQQQTMYSMPNADESKSMEEVPSRERRLSFIF